MNTIKISQRIEFNSELKKANGTWEVYNCLDGEDRSILLRRVLRFGKVAKPHNRTMLVLPESVILEAIKIGNAQLI